MKSIWDELGIEATADRGAIRRAYAARLKQTRPDDDPAGFGRLRAAYDAALAAETLLVTTLEPFPPERPQPPLTADPVEIPEAVRAVVSALDGRDVARAAALLAAGREQSALSIAAGMALSDRLLLLLATDPDLPSLAVFDAATRLGWYGTGQSFRSPLLGRLHRRIDAERWLARLRDAARSPWLFLGGHQAGAARLMLGRGTVMLSWILPPDPPLRRMAAELHLHGPFVGSAFDPDRVALIERMVRRRVTRILPGLCLVAIMVATMALLNSEGRSASAGGLIWVGFALRRYVRTVILAALVLVAGLALSTLAEPVPDSARLDTERLEQAARSGDTAAAYDLGVRYATGRRVTTDFGRAAHWFRAAEASQPKAATFLGWFAETGRSGPVDLPEARRLFAEAAEAGDPVGQSSLATMLMQGRGGPADQTQALSWYRRAAAQGDGQGLNGVGYAYLTGNGVAPDPERAMRWLLVAARAGEANAMHTLGTQYLSSRRAPAPGLAYYWLSLAVATYPPADPRRAAASTLRTEAAALLSPETVADFDTEIRGFRPVRGHAPE